MREGARRTPGSDGVQEQGRRCEGHFALLPVALQLSTICCSVTSCARVSRAIVMRYWPGFGFTSSLSSLAAA